MKPQKSSTYISRLLLLLSSVAKGPKFRPQNTKSARKKNSPGKSGAELLEELSKREEKGPNFL
jgi:hypothetical protein